MIWNIIARMLARPAIVEWLIQRAKKTPYTHIGQAGDVYMERYWLFNPYPASSSGNEKKGWRRLFPSIRLHRIMRPDQDRHMHDHPWDARTIILDGSYMEVRLEPEVHDYGTQFTAAYHRVEGETAQLKFGEYHRITQISPDGVWTMFITWKYCGTWGFLVDGKKIPWREYLGIPPQ